MTASHRPRPTRKLPQLFVMGGVVATLLILLPGPDAAARPADPGRDVPFSTQPGALTATLSGTPTPMVVVPSDRGWTWPLAGRPAVVHPFDPPLVRWSAGHRGVDLSAAAGDAVLAPASGTVTFAGTIAGRGVLVVSTPEGLRATLEPVDSRVSVGAVVARGQQIGTVGAQPGHCAPATCVHWGVLRGETYLDPLALLGLRPVVLLPLDGS